MQCFLTVFRSANVVSQNPAAPEKRLDNRFARDWWGLQRAFPIFTGLCEHLLTCQKYMQKIGEHHFKVCLHCCCFWLWLQIKLADEIRAFNLHGQGVELDPKGLLSINEDTGEITVLYAVDYEEYQILKVWGQLRTNVGRFFLLFASILLIYVHPFQLTFEAMKKETRLVDTRLGVEVQIIDANDNAPIFNPPTVEVSILESTKQGQEIVTLFSFQTFVLHTQLLRQLV